MAGMSWQARGSLHKRAHPYFKRLSARPEATGFEPVVFKVS
jgi:hypothetical protein